MAPDSKMDYRGVGDARPESSTAANKGQGGHDPVPGDYRGIPDARPNSGTESQRVNVGGGESGSNKGLGD